MTKADRRTRKKRSTVAGMAIPATYLRQIIELGHHWSLSEQQILTGTGIHPEQLHKREARIPVQQSSLLILNMLRLSGRPGFGFEMGLHIKLTAHGQLGYALLSCGTVRDAMAIACRYVRTRMASIQLEPTVEGDRIAVRIVENLSLGPFRAFVHEAMLTLMWRHAHFVTGVADPDAEFCFSWPEPDYFAAYRDRLPKVSWSQPATLIRFSRERLDLPLISADMLAKTEALEDVERELAILDEAPGHITDRVRAELKSDINGFPKLATVAGRLFISERTLKRKLQDEGANFQKLLNEAMQQEAVRMMLNPGLDLQQIAAQLGYQDPATFTHAFRRWTGQSPSSYRREVMRQNDALTRPGSK